MRQNIFLGGQTMKKLFKASAVIIALIIAAMSLIIPVSAAGESYLTIVENGAGASVTKCITEARGEINIPETYNGLPVTQINKNAFKGCTLVTRVTVPESVTKVGSNAFDGCTALESVEFAGTVCTFDPAVFIHCSSLESITLPSGLTTIPNEAFSDCTSLTQIDIPSTVTLIGTEAFATCVSLTEINIPASVDVIRTNAFLGCSGINRFNVDSGNEVYSSVGGVLYGAYESPYDTSKTNPVTDKAVICYPSAATASQYTVADGTKIISDAAFADCTNLTRINLPNGIYAIKAYAFDNCTKLSSFVIPSTVQTIGSMAFGRTTALKAITIPGSVTDFESAFYSSGLTSVTIENGVKTIGIKSFENCKSLTYVSIPDSVETIKSGAFYGCSSLTSLTVPSSVSTIGTGAFSGCEALTLTVDKDSAAHKYAVNNSIPFVLRGVNPPVQREIVSISVNSTPSKTSYFYKETLSTSGLTIGVRYNDGSSEVVSSGFTVSPTKLTKTGTQVITVTYKGFTTSFNVSVSYAWWQIIIRIFLLGFLWY